MAGDWMEENPEPPKEWSFDKRIPISTIGMAVITLIVQATLAGWWTSKMDSRVSALENEAILNQLSRGKVANLENNIGEINSKLTDIKNTDLRDIKDTLSHMIWDKSQSRGK